MIVEVVGSNAIVRVGGQNGPVVWQTGQPLDSDTFPCRHNIPIKILHFKHNSDSIFNNRQL